MNEKTYRKSSLFPKALSACVEPLTRPVFKAQGLAGSRLLTEWPEVVGAKLARHCFVEKLSFSPGKKTDGTLTIAVENGFATELQHMQPVILERLSSYFGYKAVSRIVISHSYGPAAKPAPKAKRAAPLPADCAHFADEVSDPELKEALQSLAETLSGKTS